MPSYPGGVGLMIGIPHDKKPVTINWAYSLKSLHPPMNYDVRECIIQGKPVAEARQQIAEAAVEAKCKYLFFLGTDNTCPPHTIRQLIFHLEHFSKRYRVAGGIYCHKAPPQSPMVFRGNGIGPYWDWKVGEVFDVSGLGMDVTLIAVDVFQHLEKPWFRTIDDIEPFKENINLATMWTEDLYFCAKVTATCHICKRLEKDHDPEKDNHKFEGFGILADGGLLCEHWDNQSGTPYSLPANSKPFMNTKAMTSLGKKVVDLGCGTEEESYRTNEGTVLRVDIREEVKPDFRCDIRMTPFATAEFDVVFSSHTLEHFSRQESIEVVTEMCRILKPEGELRLNLPNLEWAAQCIMNKEVDAETMNVLYGAQTYEQNFHKMGYTPEMLEQLLRQHGFKKFVWDKVRYHMMVRAWRDPDAEVTIVNPVFNSLKTVEVARMAEEFKDGHDPNVEVKNGSVIIHPKKEEDKDDEKTCVSDVAFADTILSDVAVPEPVHQ